MLKILKNQEDVISGLIVCEEMGNASALPLVLHFLSAASTSNQKVTIVTSKFTETNYKLICSKAGIRWSSSLISFLDILSPFESFDVTSKKIMEDTYEKIVETGSSVILFDDLSIFEQMGSTAAELTVFVHKIHSHLKKSTSEPVTVLAPFSVSSASCSLLRSRCRVFAQLTPVGHGFGKDASSKVALTIKAPSSSTTKKGIILSGERTINGSWITVDQ